jgi:hypothetical protein
LSLLAPLFLLGLLAVAIPILVHLRHRERREARAFPSLMFLQRVPFRSVRRQKLEHLLLLALRAGALVLLALAFSRPWLRRPPSAAAAAAGPRELVVLLDRSYSMGHGETWARAIAAARRLIDGLAPGDRGALVLFSDRVEGAVPPTADRLTLRAGLEAARLEPRGTRYGPALKLAAEWLASSPAARKEAVLVSDFQRAGWRGPEDARLPAGTDFRAVDVGEAEAANVVVTGLGLQRDYDQGRERVLVSVRLARKGGEAVRGVGVTLEIGGRVAEEKRVDVPPSGAATATFAPVAFPASATTGRVRIAPDALPADDEVRFVLAPGQDLSVLVLDGGGGRGSVYLTGALGIGDRPRFRVERRAALFAGALAGRSVVVLNDVGALAGPAEAALGAFAAGGGGLVAVLGGGAGQGLLPGSLAGAVDRTADLGGTLAYLDHDHPALALFKAPKTGDFTAPRFLRYRRYQPSGTGRVLARFDDGAPALVEDRIGRGRVLVLTTGLDALWNDLPLKPVFLPFLHQLVKYAAGHAEDAPARQVGDVFTLPAEARGADVATPSGRRQRLAAGERHFELSEPGFYEVRSGGAKREAATLVAVNVDTAESDLARAAPEEIAREVAGGTAAAREAAAAAETAEERERRQALWWYVLAAAFLLLAAETAVSNRLSPARPAVR